MVSGSTQSSELSTPSSLYMEYGKYSEHQRGCLLLGMHCSSLSFWHLLVGCRHAGAGL